MGDTLITAGILAVVAMSEGVRRLAPGTFVVRRTAWGPWKLAQTLELGTGMHLVTWCIPFALPVVLKDVGADARLGVRRLVKRFEARARRVQPDIAVLRIVGVAVLATLVVGIPFASLRWGAWGLIVAVQLLLTLTVSQAAFAWLALRRAGIVSRAALLPSLKLLWPFTAPRAAELVQQQVVAGVPPLVVLHAMLGDDELLRALRPMVYDALHSASESEAARTLGTLYDTQKLRAFIATRPAGSDGASFCPRCTTVYQRGVRECSDCAGVALAE